MPRISQLPALAAADNADEIAIVDVSASTTKKITRGDLLKAPLPANSVTTAAIANAAVTADKIDFTTSGGVWWEELLRYSPSSTASSFTTPSFSAKKYLKIIFYGIGSGGTINCQMQVNGDTGTNYTARLSSNGGADGTAHSQTVFTIIAAAGNQVLAEVESVNNATTEKLIISHATSNVTGVANVPDRREYHGKWANTSAQITGLTFITGTNSFATTTQVIVLGHD